MSGYIKLLSLRLLSRGVIHLATSRIGIATPRFTLRGFSSESIADATPATPISYNEVLLTWNLKYREHVNLIVQDILNDPVQQENLIVDINIWKNIVNSFRRKLIKDPKDALKREDLMKFCSYADRLKESLRQGSDSYQTRMGIRNDCAQLLLVYIKAEIESQVGKDLELFQKLCTISDLRLQHEQFARARMLRRKIIFHGGPTNSGKTYHALKRLEEADVSKGGGMYCGPLRLLALEVYEQLNRSGVYTDLVTGQEQRSVPFSTHVSCTIEMVSIDKDYDVAVIDEIQMISDEKRGYAWTKALNGLRAREVHVCGGLEAANIVRTIAATNNDDFELHTYKRLTELKVADHSLHGDYSTCRPGDCIVAFSKAEIFAIKKEIEKLSAGLKCAVIYGQLPPETRSLQARMFNEGTLDILVASDAIGMGLNLNIRRIIFHSVHKRGNDAHAVWLNPSAVKQIAGRAGRLSSQYKFGEVTTWQERDLAYVRAVCDWDIPDITTAGLFPTVEQVKFFSDMLGLDSVNTKLSYLMEKFTDLSQMDGKYFLCDHDIMVTIANWLHSIPLSLPDKFVFCNAPVNTRDASSMNALYYFAAMYAQNRPVASNVRLPKSPVTNMIDFSTLCLRHNLLDLYLWLSFRFPKIFIERDLSIQQRVHSLQLIEKSLQLCSKAFDGTLDASYKMTHQKMMTSHRDGLPPESFGDVRNSTRQYLSVIPTNKLMSFPHAVAPQSGETLHKFKRYAR